MCDSKPQSAVRQFNLLLLTLLLGSLAGPMARADELSGPKSLWHTVLNPPTITQSPTPKKPWMLRSREIELDLSLLKVLKDAGARPLPMITVELFDNTNPELDVSSTVSRINDTAVIRGTFKPPIQGDFTFVITGNLLVGTIQIGPRIYKTDHIGNGRLRLVELDPDKMPRD
ncbi:exported hypothetical protein [Candidatus Nitrospira nitrosa]|uniref:Uncharacterized protein n=1 Tax=Candidatus Nitrospira nitrosa TaxID=1742972 RepID=A0A0S4L9B9_9BACT|nr:hypothetical protein [Candidatus Nitrospira nitrosa]CUS34412.1 exported hypothetical protein [Candidatus Nitrospira nitrosa]